MSMNGITGYSYNPYAYNNTYANTTATNFQGTYTDNTSQKDEKSSLNTIATIGVGLAALGGAIYAIKKGKSVNGTDSSIWKNLKTGLSEIGKTISNKIGKIFNNNNNVNEELTNAANEVIKTSQAPYSTNAFNQAVKNYEDVVVDKGNEILKQLSKQTYKKNYDSILGKLN